MTEMEITIGKGRPADCSLRCENEILCYDLLGYLRADHPEAFDMLTCDAVAEALDTHICKNLFLCNRQETSFFLLMMPGDKKFKTKDISSQIVSARLSFANESHMSELLGLTPGSVTVLGLMNDPQLKVRLVIDRDLLDGYPTIGIHPCRNTSTLKLSVADLIDTVIPALGHQPPSWNCRDTMAKKCNTQRNGISFFGFWSGPTFSDDIIQWLIPGIKRNVIKQPEAELTYFPA